MLRPTTARVLFLIKIIAVEALDIRFPTSKTLDGSDAMNPDPGLFGCGVAILKTSVDGSLKVTAHDIYHRPRHRDLRGRDRGARTFCRRTHARGNSGPTWRRSRDGCVPGDSQLRWLGPEKGVVHLAAAAVINAAWDLWGRVAQKPVWRLVSEMDAEEIIRLIDFRHIQDVLTPDEARDILVDRRTGRNERMSRMQREGLAAYTTSAGWLGYDDDKIRRLCREAVSAGWKALKFKVGMDAAQNLKRCRIAREELGPDRRLMIDANQVWEVGEAIEQVRLVAETSPWWIEEPVSPDDILGHRKVAEAVRPIRVATGEALAATSA